MADVKFCKDCRFYRWSRLGAECAKCSHPEHGRANLIDPDAEGSVYCSAARATYGGCGPSAKLFERKPPPPAIATPVITLPPQTKKGWFFEWLAKLPF